MVPTAIGSHREKHLYLSVEYMTSAHCRYDTDREYPLSESPTRNQHMTSAAITSQFRTRIDMPAEVRLAMARMLNARLADFLDLERQAKQAHWNVKGVQFMQLHELFDSLAGLAGTWSDDLAERTLQLGSAAEGTVQAIAERSKLPICPITVGNAEDWLRVVADSLAHSTNAARTSIKEAADAGDDITADILTRITGEADKQLWFVESHLEI